jgi:5-methyltetrahydrofolate--homocysteine methyltransferase
MATVKGDVHDIGKNIVGVVLGCNNFRVIDLGVMVQQDRILDAAIKEKACLIGLSGLITPSLDEMISVAKEAERRGLDIPILIGGATTSKIHTAVKIAPHYSGDVVHVLDVSKSVVVAASLIDPKQHDDFIEELDEEYEELRSEYYSSLEQRRSCNLTTTRLQRSLKDVMWSKETIIAPRDLGVTTLNDIQLTDLVPYIDWTPFFSVWQLHGSYPNRIYPKIFADARVGEEAKSVWDAANALMNQVVKDTSLQCRAVIGLFPAYARGDDIILPEADVTFYGLRQQAEKASDEPFACISDFVAPEQSGVKDYVGAFAVGIFGVEALQAKFQADHDDYHSIMIAALADRFAEAAAEYVHQKVRKEHWGYAPEEALSPQDCVKCKYSGIRPAPGYPTQPDHSEKDTMWKLLDVEARTGIQLTSGRAMLPAAAVSGLIFGSKRSKYFAVGPIGKDQVVDYAARKGITVAEAEDLLRSNLGYE